jgi:hypothetical protein
MSFWISAPGARIDRGGSVAKVLSNVSPSGVVSQASIAKELAQIAASCKDCDSKKNVCVLPPIHISAPGMRSELIEAGGQQQQPEQSSENGLEDQELQKSATNKASTSDHSSDIIESSQNDTYISNQASILDRPQAAGSQNAQNASKKDEGNYLH